MEKRIYIASKGSFSVGIEFDVTNHSSMWLEFTPKGDTEDNTALRNLITYIEKADTTELTNVVPIFINSNTYQFLNNGGYKFWLKTGLNSKGQPVSETDMKLLKKWNELWKEKGDDYVLRDIMTCKISEETKADANKLIKVSEYTRQNDAYSSACWTEVQKRYSESISSNIASVSGTRAIY
jgi:hypothetical protein